MKNIKTLLIIIGSLFVAFVIGWFSLFNIIQPPNTPEETKQENTILFQTELKIDYGDKNVTSYQVNVPDSYSAFDSLKTVTENNDITLETQQYDFGIFVKSIDGHESTAEMSWIYFVNGESGQVAADQHILNAGDIVEWKYVKPE